MKFITHKYIHKTSDHSSIFKPEICTLTEMLHPELQFTSLAYFTIAEAIGCSELASAVPAMVSSRTNEQTFSSTNMATLATLGTP